MVEREARGKFDYLLDDIAESDESRRAALADPVAPEDFDYSSRDDDRWDEPDDGFWSNEPDADHDGSFDAFDAFDSRNWNFEPAPTPWYQTRAASTALIAAAVAAVALVTSAVLLVFRSPGTAIEETPAVVPTAPTTVASTPSAPSAPSTSSAPSATEAAPPPPEPPPSPAIPAESVDPAPAQTNRPPAPPSSRRGPEIGVTRTPATKSPISVSPQRPAATDSSE